MISQHLLVLCVVIFDRQTYSNDHILCNRMNIDDCQHQIKKKISSSELVVSTKSTIDDDDLRLLEIENEAPPMSNLENLIINYVSDYIPIVGQTLKVPTIITTSVERATAPAEFLGEIYLGREKLKKKN
uniref:Uncharacterized protein n=1 Tax=Romanomermis culicivorax TaxID=13658 RepID=A0A915L994_ROMCU